MVLQVWNTHFFKIVHNIIILFVNDPKTIVKFSTRY
jgi:hypothetical protein